MGGDTSEIENMMRPYTEAAELWEEDQLMQESIREKIEQVKRMNQWGSLPGKVVDEILASTIVRIDYRQILSMFRASVLSSSRKLTRMLPSRRYGFEYMGSKRDFTTELLVAIDVSGSVTNEGISQALSIINRFFKYGVENIDVIQFDYGLQGEKMTMKKALKDKFKVKGRGGTDFQAPIDLFLKDGYDGLIMITDGFAAVPEVPKVFRGNILWLIYENEWFDISRKQGLNKELSWIKDFPRSRYTVLPPV
jgi:predicted metal-dependent peptidase